MSREDLIRVGSLIKIKFQDSKSPVMVKISEEQGPNLKNEEFLKISLQSPFAQAAMGAKKGDKVTYEIKSRETKEKRRRVVEILDVINK